MINKPRFKQIIYLLADMLLVGVALAGAFLLRFGVKVSLDYAWLLFLLMPLVILIKTFVFSLFGFYGQLWRYASLKEGMRLIKGISVASLLLLGVLYLARTAGVPRAVVVIDWLLTLLLVGGSYFVIRARGDIFNVLGQASSTEQKKVIIVGAGVAGSMLIKHMQIQRRGAYKPVVFLDDDPSKNGLMIHGVKVVGNSRAITKTLANHPADEIILAIPSAAIQERRRIAFECKEIGVPCKTIPDLSELVDGKVHVSQIRDIDPKELLGRNEVEMNLGDIIDQYKEKTILITGAAGSIGSEICRQAINLRPKKIVATDISENGLYHLEEEMTPLLAGCDVEFEARIMDVKDDSAVDRVFKQNAPGIVFHAAAFKHVPIMEKHPIEAIENNFMGTRTVIEAAKRFAVERFIFISTDKAVNPTNIMGLSKKLGEYAIKTAASEKSKTKFMAVRFGNVLGSNGSVIPRFKRLISNGEAVTVTHPDITRFFMTIQEAVYLVIQAAAMGVGGEIFVLDMGEPVKIVDLARSMIRLSGFEPDKDIPIKFTGLRPGEKLYEELFGEGEVANKTGHPQILEVSSAFSEIMPLKLLRELEFVVMKGDDREFADFLSQNNFARAI